MKKKKIFILLEKYKFLYNNKLLFKEIFNNLAIIFVVCKSLIDLLNILIWNSKNKNELIMNVL